MSNDKKRLQKLLSVQEQIKALHEARHAGYLAQAQAAHHDADDLAAQFAISPMAPLFPEIFHRRIAEAVERENANREKARQETAKVAVATARTTIVEKAFRRAAVKEERDAQDKELLELIDRQRAAAK